MINSCKGIASVYIAQAIDVGWIIEKLMSDIAIKLRERSINVKIGAVEDYCGQDVVFHSRYLYAQPIESARLNSVFVTHIDDKLKELEIKNEFSSFDSFVCMSPMDANLLRGLGCSERACTGINLPHRGMQIRPKKIAVFSEMYRDGRKNEAWILDYFEKLTPEARRAVVICLIGYNWESFCMHLAKLGVSYELYRYDRSMPDEYNLQKQILSGMDYLLYPAFDGGAMCVYDAISAGVGLIISDVGYHKNLISGAKLFSDKKEFFLRMDEVLFDYHERSHVIDDRSIDRYVDQLLMHWQQLLTGHSFKEETSLQGNVDKFENQDAVEFYRKNYKNLTIRRMLSSVYRFLSRKLSTSNRPKK